MMKKPIGIELYRGPSLLTGDEIVVIATGIRRKSRNRKTGNMISVWILCAGKHPMTANQEGLDEAVCGNCKHRIFRSCYVNMRHGPTHVWEAWKRGVYPIVNCWDSELDELMAGRHVRIGSFGDPAAVPISVWNGLLRNAAGETAYTHQWATCPDKYKALCMASCETLQEVERAKLKGWRVFYARRQNETLPKGFFVCPASVEGGKKTNCEKCGNCRGGEFNDKPMPSILLHGTSWKQLFFERGMQRVKNHKKIYGVAWQVSPKVAAMR